MTGFGEYPSASQSSVRITSCGRTARLPGACGSCSRCCFRSSRGKRAIVQYHLERCVPIGLPAQLQLEFSGGARSSANQDRGVGRVGEWDGHQLIDSHLRGDGYCRRLDDVDRPLADNMTSQYLARLAVDYQFAEAERPPVDNRAGGRVEIERWRSQHRAPDGLRPR